MRAMLVRTICAFVLLLCPLGLVADTQVIKGTVVTPPAGAASVQVKVGTKVITVNRTEKTVIARGQVGKPSRAVALREFVAGDQFVAIIEDGQTVSMKAFYNPHMPVARPSAPLKIRSVTFSAPVPLKPGDIITVDLAGTPKQKAAFAVRGLTQTVWLKELSPGSYHGNVQVPKGKTVRNAPLVGYLGVGDVHAPPVMASRLVTLLPESELRPVVPLLRFADSTPKLPEPSKLPVVRQATVPEKPAQAPQPVVVRPEQPEPVAPPAPVASKIVLTSPADGATIRRVITVKGTAEPDTDVRVTITYANGLTGLLRLSGNVASQNVSVGKNGEFRMGPIALDGPLATNGLRFTIKAYYPDHADHGTAQVVVTGDRD